MGSGMSAPTLTCIAAPRRRSRGHIETRPNGRFRVKVYAGQDPLTGKQRYLTTTTGTYREAEVELTKLLGQVDENRHPRSSVTVSRVVAQWLEVAELADTTRQRYQGLVRLYIEPALGAHAAAKLDAELLERLYSRMRRCNRLCTRKARDHVCRPLSASTVRQTHFVLRAALDRAVRWNYLGVNVAAMAEPPAFECIDPDPPSAEEIVALLNDAWRDPTWGLFLWLTMVTGCRRGEMCALRWSDVDLTRRVVSVSRSYSQTAAATRDKTTKSNQKRRLALDEHTVSLLLDYRTQCEASCAELGVSLPPSAFVFSNSPDGSSALLPSTVTQRYRRVALRAGLRSTRLHALRHYSATELLTAGVDLRTVAGRLGHGSGGGTTLRFYAAWVEAADQSAAQAIAMLMPTPDPTRRPPRHPYEMVAADLRKQIESGALPPGTPLPTSTELSAIHDVSAGTVNRAIALLKESGLVEATRGRRAQVAGAE
jgi:integrase